MATTEADRHAPLDTGGAVFDLLRNPRKAWVYTYIRQHPDTAIDDIVESTSVPQRTVYEYVTDLETAGFVERANEGRPARYVARDIDFQLAGDGVEREITPALIEAVARRERDQDIDAYVDRHGLDGLAVALEYAREYVDGSVTHRILAREQDVSPIEAGVILDALRHVVRD